MMEIIWNPISIASVLNALSYLVVGSFVFLKNPRARINRLFFIMSVFIAGWAFFLVFVCGGVDKNLALFFSRLHNQFALFIPVLFLHLTLAIIDRVREHKKVLIGSYFINITVFILSLLFPKQWVGSVSPKMGFPFYTDEPGVLYPVFTLLFVVEAGYAINQMIRIYPSLSGPKKIQVRYLIMSSITGFVFGGSTFLLVYDIPAYPWLDLFMWVSAWLLGYSIVKHRLFEIETVIHRTVMWLLASSSIFIPIVLFVYITKPFLRQMEPLAIGILMTVMFFIFKHYHMRIQPKIDHLFRRRKYDYSQILSMLSLSLKGVLDIKQLSVEVSRPLKEALYLEKIAVVIKDIKTGRFLNLIEEGFSNQIGNVSMDDSAVRYLHQNRHLEPELVEVDPRLSSLKESRIYRFFTSEDIPLVLSLSLEEDFLGFIILGKKQNLQHYTLKDIEILENISQEISLYFYNALHHQDILEKQRLEQEIFLAKNIQENLLPQKFPSVSGLSLYGLYSPSKEIGGDYYDFIMQRVVSSGNEEEKVYITIGDVSGKGLDAGLVVSSVKSALVSLARYNDSPRELLNLLNQDLYNYLGQQKFISLLLFNYVSRQNKIVYSSAGHERILFYRSGQTQVEIVKSGGIVLGMIDDIGQYLEEHTLNLSKGDKILLYTDGATEARNPEEELYSLERLVVSFQSHAHLAIKEVVNKVYEDIKTFISTRDQYDDITLVGIEKE